MEGARGSRRAGVGREGSLGCKVIKMLATAKKQGLSELRYLFNLLLEILTDAGAEGGEGGRGVQVLGNVYINGAGAHVGGVG